MTIWRSDVSTNGTRSCQVCLPGVLKYLMLQASKQAASESKGPVENWKLIAQNIYPDLEISSAAAKKNKI